MTDDQSQKSGNIDLEDYLTHLAEQARIIIEDEQMEHKPFAFVMMPGQRLEVYLFADFGPPETKQALRALLESRARAGAQFVVWLSEAWLSVLPRHTPPSLLTTFQPSTDPGRREMLILDAAAPDRRVFRTYEILRGDHGERKLARTYIQVPALETPKLESRFTSNLPWK